MFFSSLYNNKEAAKRRAYTEVVSLIENDVREFVEQELIVFNRNPNNKNLADSVIANLALFDLSQLKTENGVLQIRNLFNDHHNQIVNHRMKHLLTTIYIRYGTEVVDDIATVTIRTIKGVYDLDKYLVRNLDSEYIFFWLQPFIRKAWDDIFNSAPDLIIQDKVETPEKNAEQPKA